jgi:tetratricopeptide (TPR) repeat protein
VILPGKSKLLCPERKERFWVILLIAISALFIPDRVMGQANKPEDETTLKAVSLALRQGKPKEALIHCGKIPESSPQSAPVLALYGLALLDCADFEMARQKFEAACRIRPNCPEAKLGLGELELSLLRWPEALPLLQQAQGTNVLLFRAAMDLSQCFLELGQRQEALSVLRNLQKNISSLNEKEREGIERRIGYLEALGKADIYAMDSAAPKSSLSFAPRNAHVIIPVTINGLRVKCHVDTGNTGGLAIDKKTAEALRVKAIAEKKMAGVGGESVGKIGLIKDFQIGKLIMRHVPVDLVESCLGGAAEANLGLAILRRFNISIDYQNKQLVVFPLSQSPHQPSITAKASSVIPFRIKPLIIIPAKINGGPEIPCIFDTGAGIPVLHSEYYSESLQKGAKAVLAANGKKGLPYLINALELGDLTFRNIFSAVLDLTPIYETGSFYVPAVVGASVLQNSLICIDFKNMKLTIETRD